LNPLRNIGGASIRGERIKMYDQAIVLLAKLLLAGGGLAAIIWKIVEHFGTKWLTTEFEKRVKALEHEHDKEIEQLRSDLTRAFDRRSKLHQREFEVLPEVWAKTCDAYWNTRGLVSSIQSHPDLNRMSGPQLEAFIAECDVRDWQKEELQREADKTRYYADKIFWHRLQKTRGMVTAASNTLGKLGIFINKDTRKRIDDLTSLLWSSLAEEEMNHSERPVPRLKDDIGRLMKDGEKMREDLESEIRDILWEGSHASSP
jgi:hypothetical protein